MSKRRKPVRAPFVVTFSAVALTGVASLAGCAGKIESVPGGGGELITNPPPPKPTPQCPGAQPTVGASCSTTTPCSYSEGIVCGPVSYVCTDGAWRALPSTCNPPPPACPDVEPTVGRSCVQAGARCSFKDSCAERPTSEPDSRVYTCFNGEWQRDRKPYEAACPSTAPSHGDPCTSCGEAYPPSCGYGDCGGTPTIHAKCDLEKGTWSVAEMSCNPPPPPIDGGAGP
ncbi:MAG: hypothetical protein KC657_24755 [Myxococcales bacterium]|nr:hypothetical protein [Myxococcales bacterium]